MITLLGIVAFHLLVIICGRHFKRDGVIEKLIIGIITLLLVGWVALNMYIMEKPEPDISF